MRLLLIALDLLSLVGSALVVYAIVTGLFVHYGVLVPGQPMVAGLNTPEWDDCLQLLLKGGLLLVVTQAALKALKRRSAAK